MASFSINDTPNRYLNVFYENNICLNIGYLLPMPYDSWVYMGEDEFIICLGDNIENVSPYIYIFDQSQDEVVYFRRRYHDFVYIYTGINSDGVINKISYSTPSEIINYDISKYESFISSYMGFRTNYIVYNELHVYEWDREWLYFRVIVYPNNERDICFALEKYLCD